jgi:hypothetical protein
MMASAPQADCRRWASRYNDLYDGDICVYSVMLCVQGCLALVKIVAKASLRSHFWSGEHK